MFSKLAVAFVASLAVFVAAAPTGGDIKDSCNTGKMYCCNDTYEANSKEGKVLKEFFHLSIPANTKIGATCSPITGVLGIGSGSSCNQQPVCCSGNDFQGLVVVGCSPVNVNL